MVAPIPMSHVRAAGDLLIMTVLRVAIMLLSMIGIGLLIEECWRTVRCGLWRRRHARRIPALRRGILSGLAGLLALAQLGCTVWIGKHDIHVQWDERRVVEERIIGEARASAVAHADGLGWTVDVREPVEQVLARTGKRAFTAHRFYVAPGLSWGVAALGCGVGIPMGVPVLALNALVGRWDMFTERYVPEVLIGGCVYPLIGLVPGGRNVKAWERIEDPEHREEAWRPVSEAEVGIRLAGRPWIRYPVEPDGQRSVRVEHVPLAAEGAGVEAVELGVWVRGVLSRTWTERVSEAARTRLAEEPRVPREAWPARLTVGVWGWEGLPGAVRERSERRLVEAITRVVHPRGGQVLWLSSLARPVLEAERRRQYEGGVAEQEQVAVGREAGATILVRPVARRAGGLWQVGVDVWAVEAGTVWTAVSWEVPEAALASAAEAVRARVVRLLAQAPGGGQ